MPRTFVWWALAIVAASLLLGLCSIGWMASSGIHSEQADPARRTTTAQGETRSNTEALLRSPDLTTPELSACAGCGTVCDVPPIAPLEPVTSVEFPDAPKPIPFDLGNRKFTLIKVKLSKTPPTAAEMAIRDAQEWLMQHQQADGGWSFDHSANNPHAGPVNNPGKLKSTTGATGLAMMALLRTPDMRVRDRKHAEEIQKGAKYLLKQQEKNLEAKRHPGDLRGEEGDMFCQAWATIALCEAYNGSRGKTLEKLAQDAITYIESVQHADGGWGRSPGQPGECLVSAWNIEALKVGHLAYLNISRKAVHQSITFFDSIQSDGGVRFGSTKPDNGDAACTAAGLLCRMYLGKKRDDPAIGRGVTWLSQRGPAPRDVIYNYHASHVMVHWGNREGIAWREKLDPQILAAQKQTGSYSAEKGSWFVEDERIGDAIGRLGCTALQSLTVQRQFEPQPHQWVENSEDF